MSTPLQQVRAWLEADIVGLDLCPFARRPLRDGLVHLVQSDDTDPATLLAHLLGLATQLDAAGEGTTLLVMPHGPGDFDGFMDLFYAAEDALSAAGFDRRIQVVGFHPAWVFEGADPLDPANAVQRSPVPLLHLLRWQDVFDAIEKHPNVRDVPVRNARLLRERAGWEE